MIYLDYQATTPLAAEVAEKMRPWIETNFGNPHSPHRPGREAAAAIQVARDQVMKALGPGAEAGELYFTSGATEAANWALKGAAADLDEGKTRITTLGTEHACVLDTAYWLSVEDMVPQFIGVQTDGLADLQSAAESIDERTGIVAAMLVNNEIGVIQPIEELSALARDQGALFFCDAVQAFGRVDIPFHACDMVAVSAHKVHGPKGIGALWIRKGVEIEPLFHGGGQEGGLRSGTLSPALCVGFGEAARLISERRGDDAAHIERLWELAVIALKGWTLNGSDEHRYKGNINVRKDGIDTSRLISEVREVAFSAGSACGSGSGRTSHVLAALGLNEQEARSSIRLGFGRYTTEEELSQGLDLILAAAEKQRII